MHNVPVLKGTFLRKRFYPLAHTFLRRKKMYWQSNLEIFSFLCCPDGGIESSPRTFGDKLSGFKDTATSLLISLLFFSHGHRHIQPYSPIYKIDSL